MLNEKPKLSPKQLDLVVAYLKGTRNSVDNAFALVGAKFSEADDATMFDFNMRVSQCRTCFFWFDMCELNEEDQCEKCQRDESEVPFVE